MSDCSIDPIELVLATTDSSLYDEAKNKWIWSGSMYWTVECLPNRQTTVSDNVSPRINPDKYMVLDTSPITWDYCKSQKCSRNSDTMQIIFTFDPKSTDPNDYLQFVIDIHCKVTDYPDHGIKDAKGEEFYLDIVEVSKMIRQPYVEIWIARTFKDSVLTLAAAREPVDEEDQPSYTFIWVIIILVILLVFFVSGFFLYRYYS